MNENSENRAGSPLENHSILSQFIRHQDLLYTIALRMTNNASDADELIQDCFLQVQKKYSTYRGECSVKHWLIRILENLVYNDSRRKKMQGKHLQELSSRMQPSATKDDSLEEAKTLLEESIAKLDPETKLPLLLYYYDKMSQQEISEFLGCSQSAVAQRIKKAVDTVRAHFQTEGYASLTPLLIPCLSNAQLTSMPLPLAQSFTATVATMSAGPALHSAGAAVHLATLAGGTVVTTKVFLTTTIMVASICLWLGYAGNELISADSALDFEDHSSIHDDLSGDSGSATDGSVDLLRSQLQDETEALLAARGEVQALQNQNDKLQQQMQQKDQLISRLQPGIADTAVAETKPTKSVAEQLHEVGLELQQRSDKFKIVNDFALDRYLLSKQEEDNGEDPVSEWTLWHHSRREADALRRINGPDKDKGRKLSDLIEHAKRLSTLGLYSEDIFPSFLLMVIKDSLSLNTRQTDQILSKARALVSSRIQRLDSTKTPPLSVFLARWEIIYEMYNFMEEKIVSADEIDILNVSKLQFLVLSGSWSLVVVSTTDQDAGSSATVEQWTKFYKLDEEQGSDLVFASNELRRRSIEILSSYGQYPKANAQVQFLETMRLNFDLLQLQEEIEKEYLYPLLHQEQTDKILLYQKPLIFRYHSSGETGIIGQGNNDTNY